jgi:tetratricopeptide (TPR) repeat protein
MVAKYNHISDATKIRAGKTLKIPEIEGTPFLARAHDVKTEAQIHPDYDRIDPEEYPREVEKEKGPAEIQTGWARNEEQVALYLDLGANLFQEQRYQEALEEFQKVLRVYPKNDVAADYLNRLHLQQAGELLERNEFLPARDQFREALRYNATCDACRGGILHSENLYKDYHYKKGMQHFNNEQLLAAIEEWERVIALDSDYKRTDDLIQKARTILKNMEAIRAMEKNETAP